MKAIKRIAISATNWIVISNQSDKLHKYALAVTSTLFFGKLIIQYIIQHL